MTNNNHREPYLNGVCESCAYLSGNVCMVVESMAVNVEVCGTYQDKTE